MKGRSQLLSFILVFVMLANVLVACGGGGGETGAEQGAEQTGEEAPAEEAPAEEAPAEEAPAEEAPAEEGAAEEGAAEEGAGETAGALPADCGTVQLDYWNPFTGPDGPFMQQMTDEFNAANPNIQVAMTTIPGGEYYTQLGTAAASNTLPDVAIVHADQVATNVFRNVIRPMDDVVAAIGVDGTDYPEAVWNAGEVAGSRYAIPLDIHPMTMFYNADLIPEPPTNAEEFEEAAGSVTEGNGFMLTSGFPIQQIFQMLLYQFGGTTFNEEGTEVAWNSEAGVQALQWLKDAQDQWSEPNLEVDAELNAFKGGTVGMIWNGIWQTTNVTGEGVAFNGQATAVPQIGPNPGVWAGSHQFTMPIQEANECNDAAIGMFIRYLLDNSVTWARAGQIPARNSIRESAEFQEVQPQASIAPSVEGAFFPPSVPGITDAFAPLDEAVGAIMAGTETDIQGALDSAAERANQILADNAANYGDTPGQ